MNNFIDAIKSDWRNHDKDWTRPGFRALFAYRFGVWRMTIRWRLVRAPLSLLYRVLYRRARNIYGIELPYTAVVGENVIIEHQHGIVVHGYVEIGDGSTIRQGVTIGVKDIHNLKAVPKLGKNVDIGAGAKIIGPVSIGDNVKIGANAVVVHDIPCNSTAVGIPARVISKTGPVLVCSAD